MNGPNLAILITFLKKHEGFRAKPYRDTEGFLTIGYGTNLDAGITEEQAIALMMPKINENVKQLEKMEWYKELDPTRQIVIQDMAYNLGVAGVCKFIKMILSLRKKDFKQAAIEMLDSQYARQVKGRAKELAKILETGMIDA